MRSVADDLRARAGTRVPEMLARIRIDIAPALGDEDLRAAPADERSRPDRRAASPPRGPAARTDPGRLRRGRHPMTLLGRAAALRDASAVRRFVTSPVLFLALAVLCAAACDQRRETPLEVARAYDELQSTLDPLAPGASFVRLQAFARQNAGYAIASTVERDLSLWRQRLDQAYRQARDMAREDEFDRAEEMLTDLAQVQGEEPGRLAQEFLSFDFHHLKASRLLQRGDVAGAEAIARTLRESSLSGEQRAAVERLLDGVGAVGLGVAMTRAHALTSAARMLQVALLSAYADDGQYPATLAEDGPIMAPLRNTGGFSEAVGAIDGYVATRDEFSLVLVGKDPQQRVRVTQSRIEEIVEPR